MSGELLFEDDLARIVAVDSADFPGMCRVVLRSHVREVTDIPYDDRRHLMDLVFAVESAVRSIVAPDKVNLASLGNVTPHVHWHVIPRWTNDAYFPNSIWGERLRETVPRVPIANFVGRLRAAIALNLAD